MIIGIKHGAGNPGHSMALENFTLKMIMTKQATDSENSPHAPSSPVCLISGSFLIYGIDDQMDVNEQSTEEGAGALIGSWWDIAFPNVLLCLPYYCSFHGKVLPSLWMSGMCACPKR